MNSTAVRGSTRPRKKASAFESIVRLILFSVFVGGALVSGYFFYNTVRDWLDTPFTSFQSISDDAPIDAPNNSADNNNPSNGNAPDNAAPSNQSPSSASAAVAPESPKPRWDQKERINFLLMGLDLRPGERVGQSDTLIVVSLDPAAKSVSMLSIPRDLWVPIPGYGENRINAAYPIGIVRNYPGGGPALAKRTVQYNLGIPIHYYVTINFVGFRKLVDALGGITIDVPKDIYDPTFPDDRYGYRPFTIRKGRQLMNGDVALAYARTRHVDSDFGRMSRQQQVLKAIKDKALSLDVIPKIPALWALKGDMAQTDLTLGQIMSLAQLARDIKPEDIHNAVIDDSMAPDWITPSGAMVLLPNREKIRQLVTQLFKTNASAAQTTDQLRRLAGEGARIEISNGTATEGLAGRVSEWLKGQGFNVSLVDNADRADYAQTMVIESSERPYTRGLLVNILRIGANNVRKIATPQSNVDIHIILGLDFDVGVLPNSQ